MKLSNLRFIDRFFKKTIDNSNDELIVNVTDESGEIRALEPKGTIEKTEKLPLSLIMQPREYRFFNQPFACLKPGLYRFCKPQVCNVQHVVLDQQNPLNSIFYLSLIAIRGNQDDSMSFRQLQECSVNRLLSMTCGPLSNFVHKLACLHNIKTRIVLTHTLQKTNSYNNGHILIEVWIPEFSKYIVVDVDKKCIFRIGTKLLNIYEVCQAIYAGNPIQIETFTQCAYLDLVNFIEPSTKFNYQFLELGFYGSKNGFDQLFGRICNVPYFWLPEGYYFCAWDTKAHSVIADLFPDAVIHSPKDFKDKFYGC